MTPTKHTPIIQDGRSGCSCRQWIGAYRSDDETNGEFVLRAYEAHRRHAVEPESQPLPPGALQTSLFDQQELF